MTTGPARRARLGLLVALLALLSTGQPAAAEPSPDISCPLGDDAVEFASLEAMAPAIVAELARRMGLPDGAKIASFIAPRDAAWQVTDVVAEPLPGRRFIRGGHIESRWYVWYGAAGSRISITARSSTSPHPSRPRVLLPMSRAVLTTSAR